MVSSEDAEGQRCDTKPLDSASATVAELDQIVAKLPNCVRSVCALDPVKPPTVPASTADELYNCDWTLVSVVATSVSSELLVDTT